MLICSLNAFFYTCGTRLCNIKCRAVPGLSIFADNSTVEQAVEKAAHQDVRLTVSQLANNREYLSA